MGRDFMNIIIGTIYGYSWEEVEPFFESYRQAGMKNAKCVMFVRDVTDRTRKKLLKYGTEIVEDEICDKERWITEYRWDLYQKYLSENTTADKILLTDVRDTIFQKDIFAEAVTNLEVGVEDGLLGEEQCNADWVKHRFGMETYYQLKNYTIICAGTVLGTYDGIYKLVCLMVDTLKSKEFNYFRNCDQVNLNWLFYTGKLGDGIKYSSNRTGTIMTVAISKEVHVSGDYIVNGTGEIAAVVHQYDRMPILVKLVEKRYSSSSYLFNKLLKHRHFRNIWQKL